MSEPEQSRRLDAYIRVSQVGKRDRDSGSYITERQQEERIRAWATSQGHTIGDDGPDDGVWREIDVSGGKMDRPKLNAIMARVDAGESDGVVVYRLDRFARTLIGSLELIQRIDKRGALFASVSDSFDITTANGRMVLRTMLNLAQWELERIAENWQDARQRRLKLGWHLGPVPYGYTRAEEFDDKAKRVKATGPLVPDPIEAPVVEEIYKRRAGGQSWAAIRDWLNEAGTWTKAGVPWTHSSLTRLIGREVYLGFAGGGAKDAPPRPDCHTPLVEEDIWEAAQQRRNMRAGTNDGGALVRGLVRCASCRYVLVARNQNDAGHMTYNCSRHIHAADCPDPVTIVARPANGHHGLDDYVVEVMFRELERIEFEALDVNLGDLREQLTDAVARRDEAAEDLEMQEAMGRAAWLRRSAALSADVEAKEEVYKEALRTTGALGMPVAELKRVWPELPLDVRRNHLARAVRYVFVRPALEGAPRAVKNTDEASRRDIFAARVRVVLTGDDDVDVPRQGKRGFVIKPFTDFPA